MLTASESFRTNFYNPTELNFSYFSNTEVSFFFFQDTAQHYRAFASQQLGANYCFPLHESVLGQALTYKQDNPTQEP